ncbi:hypothetical protein NDU88_004924 [Pleurodeles waltl]|uniref:Uncharacterized protein n=1 Tax=Pleurodeles waltl TaxID=8319 RepID=A0AAV7PGB7_PLEWA|nr:hypothetical protein NDU88_004924 [Pleurodeles waltl]
MAGRRRAQCLRSLAGACGEEGPAASWVAPFWGALCSPWWAPLEWRYWLQERQQTKGVERWCPGLPQLWGSLAVGSVSGPFDALGDLLGLGLEAEILPYGLHRGQRARGQKLGLGSREVGCGRLVQQEL